MYRPWSWILAFWYLTVAVRAAAPEDERILFFQDIDIANATRAAMQGSIRTSWEQGTAAGATLEFIDSDYSLFGSSPFAPLGTTPTSTLQYALSAVVRQASDGRLSQVINDGLDEAALDGASAGSAVLLGSFADTNVSRHSYWLNAATAQLDYVLYTAPRTSIGAISSRADQKQYWSDGMYMGFPFIAYYGAVTKNQTLLEIAYQQCSLYRSILLQDGPTGPLWAHIYSDDTQSWVDQGLWATGNGWAALGMLRVAITIQRSKFASSLEDERNDLISWVKEILDGTFAALTSDNLVPDYISGGANFGDSSSSAALASVAYRAAALWPETFNSSYTKTAGHIRDAVLAGITNLGTLSPIVDPLNWDDEGTLSTEAQAFSLMMFAAWRDWIGL